MNRPRLQPLRTDRRGFTLIELMVAVVIIGVLVAVAYPSFLDSVRKGRRSEAVAALNGIQLAQERWRANNATYTSQLTNAATDTPPGLGLPATTSGGYYAMSIDAAAATSYTATATAVAGTSQAADGSCARLRVRMNGGNLFYGSATLAGAFAEDAGNPCWKR